MLWNAPFCLYCAYYSFVHDFKNKKKYLWGNLSSFRNRRFQDSDVFDQDEGLHTSFPHKFLSTQLQISPNDFTACCTPPPVPPPSSSSGADLSHSLSVCYLASHRMWKCTNSTCDVLLQGRRASRINNKGVFGWCVRDTKRRQPTTQEDKIGQKGPFLSLLLLSNCHICERQTF